MDSAVPAAGDGLLDEAPMRSPPPALAATLVLAPPLAVLFWRSGAVSPLAALAAVALVAYVVLSAGFLLLRLARAEDMPAPAAWVLGIFATAICMYALVVCLDLLAASAFVVWALVLLCLGALVRRSAPAPRRLQRSELVALLLCVGATVFWCWELAEVPQILWRDGVLATWVDQFIHASGISQFGDPRAAGRQSIQLADVARMPYHYASYMVPAALVRPLDLPGLTLAMSVWVPLGFLTVCAGSYALGATLAGPGGGMAALGALTLLPDAASYGLHNRLFGYYWYVLAVPTASYAVGVALLAIALLRRWTATRDVRVLVASAALVAGSALIRMHIFMLLLPAWLACAALSARLVRGRALLFAGSGLALFGLFVWAFYRAFPDTPHALGIFLEDAHIWQQPTAYGDLYASLMHLHGAELAVPVGVLLVLAATLGIFGILYPVSVLLLRRARRLELIDLVPLALLVWYLLLILTAPVPPHGDATEFTQRPFVLVYAAFAVWTAAGFAGWLALQGGLRRRRVWLPLLIAAAFTVMWVLVSTVGDWRWREAYEPAEGLPQAATYVRSRSQPGDLLATQGLDLAPVATDLAIQLIGMTGVPAYLSRPFIHTSAGGARARIAQQRYVALRAVERETSAEAALARLRALGIRWYVVAESDRRGPRWDPERRRAAFVDRMVAVYSTQR
jgi:hypothetical protein